MLRFSCYSCNWTTWSSFYRVLKSKHIYSRTSLYRASLYREPRYTVHHSFPPKISVNFLILGKIPCFHRIILFIFAIHHGAAGPGPVARYHATVTWQCCSIQWLPQRQSGQRPMITLISPAGSPNLLFSMLGSARRSEYIFNRKHYTCAYIIHTAGHPRRPQCVQLVWLHAMYTTFYPRRFTLPRLRGSRSCK